MTTYNIALTPNTDADQSVSCQAQINAVPDGTAGSPNIINLPAGRYRMDRGISLNVRSHLRLTCLAGVSTYPNPPGDNDVFFAYTDKHSDELYPSPSGNSGLQFDGVNDYVTFGATMGAASFTIETWFKWTGAGVATSIGGLPSVIPLVAKGRNETNYLLGIDVSNPATPKLVGAFEEGAGGSTPGLIHSVVGPNTILTGAWYHVAVTYDGTTLRLYRSKTGYPSGASEDWGTLTVGQPSNSLSADHASLGSALTSTGVAAGFFAGSMDEVRIWNVARTPAQIEAIWDKEATTGTGLIGRWGLNDDTGTIVDGTPGPDGTITGNPTWVAGAPPIGRPIRIHFNIGGCTDVVGSFLAVEGSNTGRQLQNGLLWGLYSATRYNDHGFVASTGGTGGRTPSIDCGFEDCYAINVWGDGFESGGPNITTSDPVLGMSNINRNIHLYRFISMYSGRHGVSPNSNDGVEFVDIYAARAGLAGMDVEPNGDWQVCWNVNMTRVTVGGRDGGFSLSGGKGTNASPLPVSKKNFHMTDCALLEHGTGGLKVSGGSREGNAGYFIVDGLTDLKSNNNPGVVISGFDDIIVKNSRIATVSTVTNSVAISVSARNSFTCINNNCNGLASDGFDILYTAVIPGTTTPTPNITHYGNVWAMGTQNDGQLAGSNFGTIYSLLPLVQQGAVAGPEEQVDGTVGQTLPAVRQVVKGTGFPTGSTTAVGSTSQLGDAVLGRMVLANAVDDTVGLIESSLPKLAQALTGAATLDVAIAQTLPALTQAVVAVARLDTAIVQTLPALSQAAVAVASLDAVIVQTLPALTQLGIGLTGDDISGGVVQSLPALSQVVEAFQHSAGPIAQALPVLVQAADAVRSDSAVIAQTLPTLAQAISGESKVGSAVAQTLPALTQALEGTGYPDGLLAVIDQMLPAVTQASSGPGGPGIIPDDLYEPFVQPGAADNNPYAEVLV